MTSTLKKKKIRQCEEITLGGRIYSEQQCTDSRQRRVIVLRYISKCEIIVEHGIQGTQ